MQVFSDRLKSRIAETGPLSRSEFETRFMNRNTPVVLRGALAHIPALERWGDPEYFRRLGGHKTFKVDIRTKRSHADLDSIRFEQMNFGEYIDRHILPERGVHDENSAYLGGLAIQEDFPELCDDFSLPEFVQGRDQDLRSVSLFYGRESYSTNHFHFRNEAFLGQVHGRKRFYLFPPRDTSRLYPYPSASWNFISSQIDLTQPIDRERFPRATTLEHIEVDLEPGDAIYIPLHWWHAVYGPGISVSLSYFWPADVRRWSFPQPGFHVMASMVHRRVLQGLMATFMPSRTGI